MSATSFAASSVSSTAASAFACCVSQDVCQILHEKLAREGGEPAALAGACS